MTFPESAIRKRLAAGYRRENKHHGRGFIDVDAAIKDVKTCLKEIEALRREYLRARELDNFGEIVSEDLM